MINWHNKNGNVKRICVGMVGIFGKYHIERIVFMKRIFRYIDDRVYNAWDNKFIQILELTIFNSIPNICFF